MLRSCQPLTAVDGGSPTRPAGEEHTPAVSGNPKSNHRPAERRGAGEAVHNAARTAFTRHGTNERGRGVGSDGNDRCGERTRRLAQELFVVVSAFDACSMSAGAKRSALISRMNRRHCWSSTLREPSARGLGVADGDTAIDQCGNLDAACSLRVGGLAKPAVSDHAARPSM